MKIKDLIIFFLDKVFNEKYCNKKNKADELKYILNEKNFSVSILHGDIIQKEREIIMSEFRTGKTRILITTDIFVSEAEELQIRTAAAETGYV